MKASIIALAASTLLGGAAAKAHHGHTHFHAKKQVNVLERGAEAANATCGCEILTTTIYGSMTLCPQPPPAPTPIVSTYSSPGTYTIVHSTVTLTETTTVASASVATLTPGEGTYGGVTTTVPTPCTVTVPVGTVSGTGKVTTSVVVTSTHTCSSAGVCVVGGTTTSVSVSTISVYPVPATYSPGTYTVPDTTVTVTETGTIFVCPFASVSPTPAPSPSPSPSKEAPAPVVSAAAYSSPVAPVVASPKAEAPAPPKKPTNEGYIGGGKPKGGDSSDISANGNKWAMTYTPYTSSGSCKSAGEVSSDIAQIKGKGFSAVRLYATDCSGLVNVGNACADNGMKLLVGIFIDASGLGGAQEQVSEITSWAKWDIVEMVVVGNEAIFNGYASAVELAAFIVTTKGQLAAAGYNGPVTTTEPLGTLQEAKFALCPVIDVVAANIQPFFNGDVSADSAGDFVASQLQLTGEQCPGKTAYNLECGWPTSGSANGAAVPGASEQHAAMAGILGSDAAARTVVFSFQNDAWKAPGEFGVEQFFGVADILAGL